MTSAYCIDDDPLHECPAPILAPSDVLALQQAPSGVLAVHYFKIVDRDLWLISADGVRVIPSSQVLPSLLIAEMLVMEKSCSLFSRCIAYCSELLPLSRPL